MARVDRLISPSERIHLITREHGVVLVRPFLRATVVILLLLIGSLLFLCIGILGEYLGIVMKEVKRRPIAVVQQQLGLDSPPSSSTLILETNDLQSSAR